MNRMILSNYSQLVKPQNTIIRILVDRISSLSSCPTLIPHLFTRHPVKSFPTLTVYLIPLSMPVECFGVNSLNNAILSHDTRYECVDGWMFTPPTSHRNSLVGKDSGGGGGHIKDALVDVVVDMSRMVLWSSKDHQRVIKTRWCHAVTSSNKI